MVCLSADQFAENLLEYNGADVKRSKLAGRSGILMWKWTSGTSGPPVTSRPDEEMPTVTARMEIPTVPPLAPPLEEHVPEIRGHSNSGGGDVAAKTEMVICNPNLCRSCENEGDWQSRPSHKHSRSAYSRPAERERRIDRYWPDHHCTEVTGMQERHLRDDGVVGTLCHFQGQVHHYCE